MAEAELRQRVMDAAFRVRYWNQQPRIGGPTFSPNHVRYGQACAMDDLKLACDRLDEYLESADFGPTGENDG